MKIFSNFDTKLDEKKIKDAINLFWKYKVLLFKRHQVYLAVLIIYFLFITVFFLLVITSIYFQLENNLSFKYFTIWIFSTFFLIWFIFTIIKIKSFLVWYNPIILGITTEDFKDGKFERFIKISFLFYLFQLLTAIWLIIWEYIYVNQRTLSGFVSLKAQILFQIFMFILMFKVLLRIIKFEMDYYIITPKYIDYNEQYGLFSKQNTMIERDKITSIRFINSWIINSYLNYWVIYIFTEWNSETSSEFKIFYAPKIDLLNRIISEITGIKS